MQTFTMKRVLLVGGVSAAICFSSTLPASANLLLSPGFETTTGWTAFNGANAASNGSILSGARSGRVSASASSNVTSGIFQTITNITAGSAFDLTGFADCTNQITFGRAGIQGVFFNASGVNLGTVETSPGNAKFSTTQIDSNTPPNFANVPDNPSGWVALDTGVFTAPANTAYMQVFVIGINLAGATSSVWFDNLDLEAVPEPSTIALGMMGIGLPLLMRRRRSR